MATQQEVIKTFMQSLNDTTLKGGKALDEAIKASSKFKSFSAVKKQFLADMKAADNWHTFLVQKCGIVLDNKDTGAISGADAGGSKAKGATDILPSTGTLKYPEGRSFTVDGLTIYGIPDESFLTDDQKYVIKGLYSWWIRDALALIKESYGFSFTDANATNSRLKMKFVNEPDSGTFAYVSYDNIDGKTEKVYESRVLCVNMAMFQNMSSDNRHGSTDSAALDRVLIHELVHGIMASNVNYFYDLPDFLKEGGSAELIHGLDDENYDEIVSYAKDPSIFEKILTTTGFEEPPYEIYSGGYIFMRYFAKQAGTDTKFSYDTYRKSVSVKNNFATNYWDVVTMKGGKSSDTITNSGSKVSIGAGKGNDTIKTYSDKVTVNAGEGNDFIFNEGSNVTILGGKGNDTVDNEGDNVKITGDAGKDIISNLGDTVTIDGGADNDRITNSISGYETVEAITAEELEEGILTSNGVTVMTSDGDAYVANLKGGNNSTLKGGAGNDSITNYAGDVKIYGDAGGDAITNCGFNATINGGAGNDFVLNDFTELDFDDDTVSVTGYQAKIYGGEGDDTVSNLVDEVEIYGENGADSISNSGDNASIYGGAGVDDIENEGTAAYISLGDGNDFFENSADSVTAEGDAGEDQFTNFGDEANLNGGADDDAIFNYGDYSSLAGGAGDDYIYSSGESSSLAGGDGKDILYNDGVNASVFGGAGNDTLFNEGDHITLSGGKGNDEIYNEGKHITYNFGKDDGKDTIVGFNAGDTIKITSGTHSAKKSGSNVIVTVGKATLTLQDAVGKKINFISAKNKSSTATYKVRAKVSAYWFDEKILATADDLSAIVKDKNISTYSVSELDSNLTSLTKKNNLVAYSGSKK